MNNQQNYRFVLRQTCTGTVGRLLANRDCMARGQALQHFTRLNPKLTADDIRFLWLGMLLDASDVNQIATQAEQDDQLLFRSVLLVRQPPDPSSLHEVEPLYLEPEDVPF